MSLNGEGPTPGTNTVAVAVKGRGGREGGHGGKGSRRAVRWAVKELMPKADRFILVYVMPAITSIPTPSGDSIPIEELKVNVVEMYVQDMRVKSEEIFVPFKKLCKSKSIETLVLEGDNPASALLTYITNSGVRNLVMGSCSSSCFSRKLKAYGVPSIVLKHAPEACKTYVVSRHRLIRTKESSSTSENCSGYWLFTWIEHGYLSINNLKPGLNSSSVQGTADNAFALSSAADPSDLGSRIIEIQTAESCPSGPSSYPTQSDVQAEVERLRLEFSNTVKLYNRACQDLAHAQSKVETLSSECLEGKRQVNAAMEREELYRKIAAEEREKHLEVVKEVEMARHRLACEAYERQIAELKALKESMEKQKIVDELFSNDRRYRRYNRDEIEKATDLFSEAKMIGEGAYGKVYRCSLNNTPVAVKILQSDALDKEKSFCCEKNKKAEFLREVEVLCQLRHPHIVLLLGACPEIGCLVYEYMENGSLEDHISHRSSGHHLPWFIRFRIAFEIACGLAFLHNSKPEPIVHRDLKPANIFLDRNYVSKVGDLGLAKLFSDVVPDDITEYRDSMLAGTLYYMDPEYQRTGTVRPKSDLYAFGIIILQLLTGRRPNGILLKVENALKNNSFSDILDKSIADCPLAEAEELAQLALKCSRLRCRDRPDLDTEVLPVLRKLADFADASLRIEKNNFNAPNHYYCPILQEVMDDPHIAADGFTYEHRAIKVWLERHKVSPVTRLRLQHSMLIPNNTLRSAIQEWKSRVTSSSVCVSTLQ